MAISSAILVIGSLNLDRIWLVHELPRPGETVTASAVHREFGGKGANQAMAVARLGIPVSLVGAVGDDPEGRDYLGHLKRAGVGTDFIRTTPHAGTGAASIYVDAKGENSIVIESGANRHVDAADALAAIRTIRPTVVVAQLEVPPDVIAASLAFCAERGIKTLLNPSPVRADFHWGLQPVHTVVVNETETRHWFGLSPADLWRLPDPQRALLLERRRIQNLVITRGGGDTCHFSGAERLGVPALPVEPIDTVGAGDTFAGALAVQLSGGIAWDAALRHANAAAALATQKRGAQTAMPTAAEVARALAGADTPCAPAASVT